MTPYFAIGQLGQLDVIDTAAPAVTGRVPTAEEPTPPRSPPFPSTCASSSRAATGRRATEARKAGRSGAGRLAAGVAAWAQCGALAWSRWPACLPQIWGSLRAPFRQAAVAIGYPSLSVAQPAGKVWSMAVFSLGRILATAVACAVVTGVLLAWRLRRDAGGFTQPWVMAPALLVGLLVVAWRLLGNAWLLNDDFLPGISIADIGGGAVAGLALLALTPRHRDLRRGAGGVALGMGTGADVGRRWRTTSGLVALAVLITNIVLI